MTFITGFDTERRRFTLISRGVTGSPNVEEFEDVKALDYKVCTLEAEGHDVFPSPVIAPEEFQLV